MDRPHGKGIAKETGEVSDKEKKIVKDLTRRMTENIGKEQGLPKQQQLDLVEQGLHKQQQLDLVDKAYQRMKSEEVTKQRDRLSSVHGEDKEANEQRNQYGKEYRENLERSERIRDEIIKGILEK